MQRVLSRSMAARAHPAARPERPAVIGVGFLLSQLGAHFSAAYARRIAPMGLTPPHVGVLRAIGEQSGRSQQAIAEEFGVPPSRMVGFIDDLEARGLVERRRDAGDRRVHLLHLSSAGERTLAELAVVGRDAEGEMLAALSGAERRDLSGMLTRIADQQGLVRGVHPGYRSRNDPGACSTSD
jgi:DNA-binding MarR family transcriptional regulator